MAIAVVFVALSSAPVRADATKPFPRAAVEIAGTSVVLVVAGDRIYALVDRLDDNAPRADCALSIGLADGSSLMLSRLENGIFAAPFNRAGHSQDQFTITLVSHDGSGDGAAEIVYDDVPAPHAPLGHFDVRHTAIALVGGPIGALMGGPFGRSLTARHAAVAHPATPGTGFSARLPEAQHMAERDTTGK